jgi:hypothetical protein
MVKGCHKIGLEIRPVCNNSWTVLTRIFLANKILLNENSKKAKLIILIRGLEKGFGLIHKRDVFYLTGL